MNILECTNTNTSSYMCVMFSKMYDISVYNPPSVLLKESYFPFMDVPVKESNSID